VEAHPSYPQAVPPNSDDPIVAQELLRVLRARLSDDALREAPALLRRLGHADPESALVPARDRLRRAIAALPDDTRLLVEIMAGLARETSGTRVNRTQITALLAERIPRKRQHPGDPPLTSRAVLAVEERELAPAVLRALTPTRPSATYADAEVHVQLTPASDDRMVRFSVQLLATVATGHWLVGVTGDELAADYLCATVPAVNDMICLGPTDRLGDSIRFGLAAFPLDRHHLHPDEIAFELAQPETLLEALADPNLITYPGVEWYLGDLTPYGDSPVRVMFTNSQDITYAARYCYWSAARRTYVRRITVDATRFPRVSDHRISLQPFLGMPFSATGRPSECLFVLEIDAWLEPGNGVALIWGDC
jgi:hypothetical protein